MGVYDRPYYREDDGSSWLPGRSMVVSLIIVNVGIYLVDWLSDFRLTEYFALSPQFFRRPWQAYQLLTYGFLHDPQQIAHLVFNMFFLWMFGTPVEGVYGRSEFLRIYLVAIVVAGLAWALIEMFNPSPVAMVGASGGIMAIMMLFVFNFPRQLIYIWGVLPVPAWALGALYVLTDLLGALNPQGSNVANVAHLGGAAFGFAYFRSGINLGRLIPSRWSELSGSLFRFRPKLRIHDPERDARDLNAQVDEILAKIHREGEGSLTRKERRTLEEASRRYQRRRQ
jgi:membrane associated rhomboid family serine protease